MTETDWRVSIARRFTDITSNARMNSTRLDSRKKSYEVVSGIDISEALGLPSTQRLFGLAQHSPVANRLLGIETTRGSHTEDTMRLTSNFLTQLSVNSPDLFAKLIERYRFNPENTIRHCIEYMRLHDAATLSFQGAMHRKIIIAGQSYDENVALAGAFDGVEEYSALAQILFDEPTRKYYSNHELKENIIHELAKDALEGNGALIQMLKSGKKHAPIDWLVYTARDASELMRVFDIDPNIPFPQKINDLCAKLQEFSDALVKGNPFQMPDKQAFKPSIESFVPSNIIKLKEINGEPRIIYDAKTIAEFYLTHILLRLFFTGSPWVRGTYSLISEAYQNLYGSNPDALMERLLKPENELLASDLKTSLPLAGLTPQNMASPESLPEAVIGWVYSSFDNGTNPQRFPSKNIKNTLVTSGVNITTFQETFPSLIDLVNQIDSQSLYLNKII